MKAWGHGPTTPAGLVPHVSVIFRRQLEARRANQTCSLRRRDLVLLKMDTQLTRGSSLFCDAQTQRSASAANHSLSWLFSAWLPAYAECRLSPGAWDLNGWEAWGMNDGTRVNSSVFTFQPTRLLSESGEGLGRHLISTRNREYGRSAAIFNCPWRPVLLRQKLGTISRRLDSAGRLKRLINPRTIMANMGSLQTKSLFRCPPSSPRDSSHGLDVGER